MNLYDLAASLLHRAWLKILLDAFEPYAWKLSARFRDVCIRMCPRRSKLMTSWVEWKLHMERIIRAWLVRVLCCCLNILFTLEFSFSPCSEADYLCTGSRDSPASSLLSKPSCFPNLFLLRCLDSLLWVAWSLSDTDP